MPTPQMVNYLSARPRSDGRRAARNVRAGRAPRLPTDQLVSASPEADQRARWPRRRRSRSSRRLAPRAGGHRRRPARRAPPARRRDGRRPERPARREARPWPRGEPRRSARPRSGGRRRRDATARTRASQAPPARSRRARRRGAADRAPDRPAVRDLPGRCSRFADAARRLPARLQGRRAEDAGRHAARRGRHADRQARHDHRPQRRRAGRLRGRGDDLRDALPGQGPGRHRAPRSRRILDRSEDKLLEGPRRPQKRLRLPRAQGRGAQGRAHREAGDRGHRRARRRAALLPRGRARRAGGRLRGRRQQGPLRPRAAARRASCAAPTASSASCATRAATPVSLDQLADDQAGQDLRLTLDVPLQDRAEQVLAGVGRTYQPKGATAIVMDPDTGDVLAMANWPRVDANKVEEAPAWARLNRAVGFTYEPGSTFKSFTVAGALSENVVRPRHALRRRPADPGRRPRDQGGARHRRDLHRVRHPRALVERRRGADRTAARRAALRPLGAHASASARSTDLPLPGESQGIVPTVQGLLRLLDREPADRPGPRRHADADGRRLRGDRQRRRAREAAARDGRGRRRRAAA